MALYFESELVLKFYNLETRCLSVLVYMMLKNTKQSNAVCVCKLLTTDQRNTLFLLDDLCICNSVSSNVSGSLCM